MCEATVLAVTDEGEQVLMKDVALVQPEGDLLLFASLMGEQKLVRGRIDKIDLLRHRVYVIPQPDQAASA
jgi:predicted RNA-binding protein